MMKFQRHLAAVSVIAFVLAVSACASNGGKNKDDPYGDSEKTEQQLRAEAAALYGLARKSLDNSDFDSAVTKFDELSKRYPFTEYATQGEVERIYALYRGLDPDKALTAADRFMREHPRNPSIDYVLYLKGLTNFNRDPTFSSMLGVSAAKGDVTNLRRSFDDFALLSQKFPNSQYVSDARERMIYLRNTIAEHEIGVVRFYVRRGAFLAAANRAGQVVSQYPGAPASYEALELMEQSYREAGLIEQADDARRILMAQPPRRGVDRQASAGSSDESWWSRLTSRDEAKAGAPKPPVAKPAKAPASKPVSPATPDAAPAP